MIRHRTNIKITFPKLIILLVIILTAASCNPTKYVPSGERLLNRNELVLEETGEQMPATVSKSALKPYLRQQPNKKILGMRFYLGLYNLSDIEKDKWPHSWLRRIGEEPVIFDPSAADRAAGQIGSYLQTKGFFNASVKDSIITKRNEVEVIYTVDPGKPYTIADIRYEIQDSLLYSLVMIDTMNCTIERGMIYDVDLLQKERQRLERFIRDIGFYAFSTENIFFRIDSTLMTHQVIVYYVVSRMSTTDRYGRTQYSNHMMYRVKDVYVYPSFDPRMALTGGDKYTMTMDTTFIKGIYFVAPPGKTSVKPEVITRALYVLPGTLFSVTNAEQTEKHLAELKNHRLVNITYNDVGTVRRENRNEGMLDCVIQLTPMERQSFTVELEGTNSGGNIGGALNLIYQNKSLFRGAEVFSLKLKGAYETLTEKVTGFKNTQQYGIEANLRLPRFLIPFPSKENFVRKHDPHTVLQAGYNYQKVPVYARSVANLSLGYSWTGNKYTRFNVNPLSFNVVRLHYVDPEFQEMIDNMSYLAYSYRDVRIIGGKYNFVFNNQMIQRARRFWNISCKFDAAGNLLYLAYQAVGAGQAEDGTYRLFSEPFAQFIKGEVDASYHYRLNDNSSIVYRLFAGLGWPYGNSGVMPFEEQYFGGGANDIRAWMVRSLGPGSYVLPRGSPVNQIADMKLEMNAEYRLKLFWILEGAVFVDAGNIWTIRADNDRPGSQFKFNTFLDDIAVGTGVGLRFDIKFLLLRLDLGLKLRDPRAMDEASKWIWLGRGFDFKNDKTIVIGIGYPF